MHPGAIAALIPELQTRQQLPVATDGAIGTMTASPELLDAVVRLLRLRDAPGDATALGPLIEREIVWRLLTGSLGPTSASWEARAAPPRTSSGRSAGCGTTSSRRWAVPELARIAGMSASTFHRRSER
ncbi:MAG: AraC family transcriptional regulator [Galbitalea sp.]